MPIHTPNNAHAHALNTLYIIVLCRWDVQNFLEWLQALGMHKQLYFFDITDNLEFEMRCGYRISLEGAG